MKEIRLTQGKAALVDDADFGWLNQWKWHAHRSRETGAFYARRQVRKMPGGKQTTILMHQLVAEAMGFGKADHKDLDGLNNQRNNLRPATAAQNGANRANLCSNTSGYIGVSYKKANRKWVAYSRKNGSFHHIGLFDSAAAAAVARDAFVLKSYGEFARLNFCVPS